MMMRAGITAGLPRFALLRGLRLIRSGHAACRCKGRAHRECRQPARRYTPILSR